MLNDDVDRNDTRRHSTVGFLEFYTVLAKSKYTKFNVSKHLEAIAKDIGTYISFRIL